jgi:serine protease Do
MTHIALSKLAGLGVLLLTFGSAPAAVPGQSSAQAPSKPAAPKTPTTPQACAELDSSAEQLSDMARTIQQNLQAELSGLEGRIAEEVDMSSPELEKLRSLSAQFEVNKGDLEERAEELASRAEALAAGIQEKVQDAVGDVQEKIESPRVFVSAGDEESGWLGIEINEVTPETAKDLRLSSARGVVVADVEPDSPAAKAGLKEKDVITQYDGQAVEGTVQFRRLVRETPPGRTIALTISRNGSTQNISVEMGDRGAFFQKKMEGKMRDFGNVYAFKAPNFEFNLPEPEVFGAMDLRTPMLGISAEDLSGQLGEYFGTPNNAGILVREVRAGTAAEKAGLKAGDVIVKVDGKAVRSLAELREQLRDKSDAKSVNLGVFRKGAEISVPVAIEKPRPAESLHMVRRAQL